MGGHSSLVIEDTSVELILSLELYLQNFCVPAQILVYLVTSLGVCNVWN